MRRVVIPELLDTDAGTRGEIEASLGDLRRINRWFGGVATTLAMLRQVVRETGRSELALLDVAAGAGDVAFDVQRMLGREGVRVSVTLLDRSVAHLPQGRESVGGDAVALPFADSTFDVVTSALFVHHLEPQQMVQFAREGLRVARVAFTINDLVRSAIHLGLVYAGKPLYRSRLTQHDAVASVKRAYTMEEMAEMLKSAGARRVELSRHYLYRMAVMAWK
jgi:2-polyprenyl-3-methyl-5-hydroxy-6-metoxy-1,4-benzoquinol methylase